MEGYRIISFWEGKINSLLKFFFDQAWWCITVIPALRKQRQEDGIEFEASLAFIVS